MWEKNKGTIDVRKVLSRAMWVLHNLKMVQSIVRKSKGTTECDKCIVLCDIDTAQCDNGIIECEKK